MRFPFADLRLPSSGSPLPLPVLEGEVGGRDPEQSRFPAVSLWPLITGPPSSRLFSLQVPVPPKIFLSMVYKLEGPSAVGVALELTTGDAGSCHVGGISALSGEGTRLAPSFLTGLCLLRGRLGEEEARELHGVRGQLGLGALLWSRPGQGGVPFSWNLWAVALRCGVGGVLPRWVSCQLLPEREDVHGPVLVIHP